MRVQLETVSQKDGQSLSMLFNPQLSDLFFWHFHPEFELVYIEAEKGTRHVGSHYATYHHNDLVLIGANIPHLNFDYGVKTEYRKVVVHLPPDFVVHHLSNVPELMRVRALFDHAAKGVAFQGEIKKRIGDQLFALENATPFFRYIKVLELLEELANSQSFELLHSQAVLNPYRAKEQQRMQKIYAFVDHHYHRKITLDEMAAHCFLTKEAFCRYFKKRTTYTFTEFLNRYRITHAKRDLLAGKSISDVCYCNGFESVSYFNRIFKKVTGETPSGFKQRVDQ